MIYSVCVVYVLLEYSFTRNKEIHSYPGTGKRHFVSRSWVTNNKAVLPLHKVLLYYNRRQ